MFWINAMDNEPMTFGRESRLKIQLSTLVEDGAGRFLRIPSQETRHPIGGLQPKPLLHLTYLPTGRVVPDNGAPGPQRFDAKSDVPNGRMPNRSLGKPSGKLRDIRRWSVIADRKHAR